MFRTVKLRCALIFARHHGDHLEHLGFVGYAVCEALRLETALHYCVIWLVVTGVWVVATHDVREFTERH